MNIFLLVLALTSPSIEWADKFEAASQTQLAARADQSAQPIVQSFTLDNGSILHAHQTSLGVQSSESDQTLGAALKTHAPSWALWSAQTGYEACARVCKTSDQRYTWTVVTDQAALFCATSATQCPAGSTDTGASASVHIHPRGPVSLPTPTDLLFDPTLRPDETIWVSPDAFSETDLLYNDVYLITPEAREWHHFEKDVYEID